MDHPLSGKKGSFQITNLEIKSFFVSQASKIFYKSIMAPLRPSDTVGLLQNLVVNLSVCKLGT